MSVKERFVPTASSGSGSLIGYVSLNFCELLDVFGPPRCGDDYKVSTEWLVEDTDTGRVFSLYDYKETELYCADLPSVDDFRKQPDYRWHIGGDGRFFDERSFDEFMSQKLGRVVKCEVNRGR